MFYVGNFASFYTFHNSLQDWQGLTILSILQQNIIDKFFETLIYFLNLLCNG